MQEDKKIFNNSIGVKIKTKRLEMKKTQSWLANKLGVTFQQIQKYEKGANAITCYNLKQVAKHLKVSILYFYIDGYETDQSFEIQKLYENGKLEPLILTKEMEIQNDKSSG